MRNIIVGVFLAYFLIACGGGSNNKNETNLSQNPQEISFTKLVDLSGNFADTSSRKNFEVVKNQERLDEIYARYGNAHIKKPIIDFQNETLLYLNGGSFATGGYDIEVSKILKFNDKIEVHIKLKEPGKACALTQAFTEPRLFVKMPKQDVKNIKFIETKHIIECEHETRPQARRNFEKIYADKILNTSTKEIDGQIYTFYKMALEHGKELVLAFDENNKRIRSNMKNSLEKAVEEVLNSKDEIVKIALELKSDPLISQALEKLEGVQIDENGNIKHLATGLEISKERFLTILEKEKNKIDEILKHIPKNPNLVEFIKRNNLQNNEILKKALEQNNPIIIFSMAKEKISEFIEKNKDLIQKLTLLTQEEMEDLRPVCGECKSLF